MVETIVPFKWSVPYSFSLFYFLPGYGSNCCWGSLGGICISCEVLSTAPTKAFQTNVFSSAAKLGRLVAEFHDYTLPISLPLLNLKLCQQLKH